MGDLVLKREYSEDGYAVPSDFLRDEHILVFGDGDPLSPLEYDIANDGKGGRTLTTKDVFEEVCIAYVPRVDLTLTKLDQGSVTGLNDYFLRVEQAIQILRWQTSKSLGGGVCDMGAPDILRDLSDLKDVVAGLSEKVAELCAAQETPKPDVPKVPKKSLWVFDAPECEMLPATLEGPEVQAAWPADIPEGKYAPAQVSRKLKPASALGFYPSEKPWEADCIALPLDDKFIFRAKLETAQ